MLACSICRELYWPGTRRLDICDDCMHLNFSGMQELRVRQDVLAVDEETVRQLLAEHQEEQRHGQV